MYHPGIGNRPPSFVFNSNNKDFVEPEDHIEIDELPFEKENICI